MIFNRWRKFPKRKPKDVGEYYLCTVRHGYDIDEPRVMVLLYSWNGKWIDTSRTKVFEGYKVYKPSRAAIDDNRVFIDNLCERADVIAWKKMPRFYRWWKFKKNVKEREN